MLYSGILYIQIVFAVLVWKIWNLGRVGACLGLREGKTGERRECNLSGWGGSCASGGGVVEGGRSGGREKVHIRWRISDEKRGKRWKVEEVELGGGIRILLLFGWAFGWSDWYYWCHFGMWYKLEESFGKVEERLRRCCLEVWGWCSCDHWLGSTTLVNTPRLSQGVILWRLAGDEEA